MTTLIAQAVHFAYRHRTVLHDIDLAARPGRVLSIIGPNGAGKTTLLKCLNGLLRPSSGRVLLGDRPLEEYRRRERSATMAYVPQAEPSRFPMRVFDAVMLGRRPYLGWTPRRTDLEVVAHTIDTVGIGHLAQRDMHELSGGERQKVGIAKAIAQDPEVLLLDEPTTYLDLEHQLNVLRIITELAEKRRVTVVMTIHDLNHALAASDDMVVMKRGKVVASGEPSCVDPDLVAEVYGVHCDVITHRGRPIVVPHNELASGLPTTAVAEHKEPRNVDEERAS